MDVKQNVLEASDRHYRVPGEIMRREVELDPQVIPEKIMRWSWAAKDFLRFGLFFNSSATDIVLVTAQRQLKQQLRSALVAAQWRGDTALTLPLFWRRSTVSPVFFRAVLIRGRAFTFSSSPPTPLYPSLISNLASVDVKQHGRGHRS